MSEDVVSACVSVSLLVLEDEERSGIKGDRMRAKLRVLNYD